MELRRGRLHQLQQGDLHRRCSRALDAIAVYGINEVRLRPGTLVTESSTEPQADERFRAGRRAVSTPAAWNADDDSGGVVSNRPLIPRLITARGLALRLYLTALYESQVRQKPGSGHTNNRLLWPAAPDDVGWLGLLAVSATVSAKGRSEMDNRLRQIKSAISRLHREQAVLLPNANRPRHRYEGFLLRNDGGASVGLPDEHRYVTPRRNQGVDIPVEFYINNWLHCLTDSEVALWLSLRLLAQEHPEAYRGTGIFMADRIRRHRFGLTRDAYESHRALRTFGLIKEVDNGPRRRAGWSAQAREQGLLEPLHFVLDDQTLDDSATEVIDSRMRSRHW